MTDLIYAAELAERLAAEYHAKGVDILDKNKGVDFQTTKELISYVEESATYIAKLEVLTEFAKRIREKVDADTDQFLAGLFNDKTSRE